MIMPNTDPSAFSIVFPHAVRLWARRCVGLWCQRTIKTVKILLLLIFFISTPLICLVAFPPDLMPYTTYFSRFLSEKTGLQLQVTRLSLQTGLSMALVGEGVSIKAANATTPLFSVKRILLRISPLSWQHGWLSTSLTLEDVTATLHKEASGALMLGGRSVDELWGNGVKSNSGRLPLTTFLLQNARVTWIDDTILNQGQSWRTELNQLNVTSFIEHNGSAHFSGIGFLPEINPDTKLFAKGELSQKGVWSFRFQATHLHLTPFNPYLHLLNPLDGLSAPLDLDAIIQMQSLANLHIQWQIKAGAGKLAWPTVFRWPFPLTKVTADGLLTRKEQIWDLNVKQFDLLSDHGQARGHLVINGIGGKESPQMNLSATASGTPSEMANYYYPTTIMYPPLVQWLDHSLKEGRVKQASVQIKGKLANIPAGPTSPKEDVFHIEGDVTGLSLHYFPPFLPLTDVTTHVEFDRYSMVAEIPKATFGQTQEVSGKVVIANMVHNPVVEIEATSPRVNLGSVWQKIVTHPQLRWDQAVGMAGANVQGEGRATLAITLPLKDLSKLTYAGQVEMREATLHPAFLDHPLSSVQGVLTLDNNQLDIKKIQANYEQLPLSGEVTVKNYQTPSKAYFSARLQTTLDEQRLSAWGEPLLGTQGTVNGEAPLWLEFFRKPQDANFLFKGQADLQSTVIQQGRMGWQKLRDDPGLVKGEGWLSPTGQLHLNPLQLHIGNLGFSSQADWDLSRNQGQFTVGDLHFGKTVGNMVWTQQTPQTKEQEFWTVKSEFSQLDLAPLWYSDSKKARRSLKDQPTTSLSEQQWPHIRLTLNADHLLLANQEAATKLATNMEMELRSLRINALQMQQGEGTVYGSGEFLWSNQIGSGGYGGQMHVTSQNFGKLLKSLDINQSMQEGSGALDVTLDGFLSPDKHLVDTLSGTARFNFYDGKLRRFGFLSTLLGLFSLKELPNLMIGDRPDLDVTGLHYKKFHGTFAIHDNVWNIDKMVLNSPSMNMVFTGQVDFPQDQVNLLVGLRPLQALDALVNSVPVLGKLVTGVRQTMIETQFDVSGSTSNPHVNIRPVTSFAPGLLRDILAIPGELYKLVKEPSVPQKRTAEP